MYQEESREVGHRLLTISHLRPYRICFLFSLNCAHMQNVSAQRKLFKFWVEAFIESQSHIDIMLHDSHSN